MHQMTTGAGNDIERATEMARKMVCEWGMSELGPLSFGKKEEQIFLGREIAQHRDYSEETAIRIDEQVKKLVQGGYDTAARIIEEHSEALVKIAEDAARARDPGRQRSDADHQGQRLAAAIHFGHEGYRRRHAAGAAARGRTPFAGIHRRGASAAGVIPRFPVYLFDIDGTLLDSAEDICGAIQQVLDANGLPARYLRIPAELIGLHLIDVLRRCVAALLPAQIDELIQEYRTLIPRAGIS